MNKYFKPTDRMKQCKSRTGMMIPCIAYKGTFSAVFGNEEDIAGGGYIIYNFLTMQLETTLEDKEGKELPPGWYSLKQLADEQRLVVFVPVVM